MALRFKSFAHPDLLKRIQPEILIRVLHPHRLFFELKGFLVPGIGDESEIEYLTLAGILAQPDEEMPSELVEALHLIGTFSDDDYFDDLLELANKADIKVPRDVTTTDLAARLYLQYPQSLERKEKEILFEKKKIFESYRSANRYETIAIDELPVDLTSLVSDLDQYFKSKKQGSGCHVIRKDTTGEVRFLIQHGHTCRREPSRKGRASTCTFFRPEKIDLVILDLVHNEMRINASNRSTLYQYRAVFGKHLFGDENRFIFAEKYTLEPLKTEGESSLNCRDIEGMQSVRLREIEYGWHGAFDHVENHRAEDLFKALAIMNRIVEKGSHIRRAVFKIKLDGENKPRTVTIRAGNKSGYGRGEEAALIENWLRARGFVRGQEKVKDAKAGWALPGT